MDPENGNTKSNLADSGVEESRNSVPSESSEKDSSNVISGIDLKSLQEKCPAFKEGCPFSKQDTKQKGTETDEKHCAFEGAKSLADVQSKMVELGSSPEGREQLGQMLGHIHTVSASMKNKVGECPIFQSDKGCPFKTICSDSVPLLTKFAELEWMKGLSEPKEVEKKASEIELSKEFKLGTKKVHRAAENIHFIREFMKGRVEQKIYLHFVASLYYVYSALEEEGERHKDHPLFKKVYYPKELNRRDTLKEDLSFFYGTGWEDNIRISTAAQKYVDRIKEVSKTDPKLLIAHHYTRYLGDLSGGQILKKIAKKTYNLPESGEGVKFYEFDEIPSATDFKNLYRKELDGINVNKEDADQLVEEAKVTFMLNIGLFKELDELSGYTEEIEHTQSNEDESARIENVAGSKAASPVQRTHESEDSPVNWLWILAVTALIFAIVMGFLTKVVT